MKKIVGYLLMSIVWSPCVAQFSKIKERPVKWLSLIKKDSSNYVTHLVVKTKWTKRIDTLPLVLTDSLSRTDERWDLQRQHLAGFQISIPGASGKEYLYKVNRLTINSWKISVTITQLSDDKMYVRKIFFGHHTYYSNPFFKRLMKIYYDAKEAKPKPPPRVQTLII
jgi:hypothetical protein